MRAVFQPDDPRVLDGTYDIYGFNRRERAAREKRITAAALELYAAACSAQTLIEAWRDGIIKDNGYVWDSPEDEPVGLRLLRAAIAKAEGKTL